MIHFLRLSDSPLLIDQLECFIHQWFDEPKPNPVPEVSEALQYWFDATGPDVFRYWKIASKYPAACLLGTQDSLAMRFWNDQPILVDENQGVWSIYVKNGELWFSDGYSEDTRLETTIPRFLLTFGLFEFVFGTGQRDFSGELSEPVPFTRRKPEAQLIWEGRYSYDTIEFWYHPKDIIWFEYGDWAFGSAKRTEDATWFMEEK